MGRVMMRWVGTGACCLVLSASACGPDQNEGSAGEAGGEGGSEAGASASASASEAGESASGSASASASASESASEAGEGSTEDVPECPSVNAGDACSDPGAVCSYGDDCGSWVYECQSGAWVQIDGSGCGADPIPCSDAPMEYDPCGELEGELCDPDGDCRDVLECEAYAWRFYEVCTAEYCPAAAPEQGKACDDGGRYCSVEHECGQRTFNCYLGYWEFFAGAICETPQPCSAAPVPNDACDTDGEVCPPPADGFPTLVCDGSTWQPQ